MKSYQIDRVSMTGLPKKSLWVEDTIQRPILPKTLSKSKRQINDATLSNNNNGNDNNDIYDTTSTYVLLFNPNLDKKIYTTK